MLYVGRGCFQHDRVSTHLPSCQEAEREFEVSNSNIPGIRIDGSIRRRANKWHSSFLGLEQALTIQHLKVISVGLGVLCIYGI